MTLKILGMSAITSYSKMTVQLTGGSVAGNHFIVGCKSLQPNGRNNTCISAKTQRKFCKVTCSELLDLF